MDLVDTKIIQLLKQNGRMTSSEMSKHTHLSIPAVAERVRKLEDRGVIERFTVKLNREEMGQTMLAFIFVILERTEDISVFRDKIIQVPEVLECHHLAGEYDYLLKVAVEGTKGLEAFISNSLKAIKGVAKTNTIIALSTLKEEV
ncbi:Lrp/AsnC family transcriptional regulator [Brevibacillus sp. SYSU BS000544]|uniref:Lrp/AsnC family transcriptional regulator n=1 Tax=Brevibacillus sp. SYSU BS000544 TaxID=3416443 RepID=UPI003CE475C8